MATVAAAAWKQSSNASAVGGALSGVVSQPRAPATAGARMYRPFSGHRGAHRDLPGNPTQPTAARPTGGGPRADYRVQARTTDDTPPLWRLINPTLGRRTRTVAVLSGTCI